MAFLKKYFVVFFFLLLSVIIPFIWLRGDYVYLPEEDQFANYQNTVFKSTHAWDYTINGGGPTSAGHHSNIIPNGIFYYLLSFIGLPNFLIQRIFMACVLFLTFMSTAYFLKLFTNNLLVIITATLFYYFNFYVKSTPFYSAKMYQLFLMPLFFTWTYKYIKTLDFRYAIYNFVCLFCFQAIFVNLANASITFLAYPLAIIYGYVKNPINFVQFIKKFYLRLSLFFLLIIPLFSYHLLIYYFFLLSNPLSILKSGDQFTAFTAPLNLILQLRGAWWEFQNFSGASYNPWLWFYNNFLIIIISLGLLGFSFYIFTLKKANKSALFFLFLFLLGTALSSGTSFDPNIYLWLFNNVPFFYIFREPWAKFMPLTIFSLSALLTISLNALHNKFHKSYLLITILLLVLIRGFPFFSPDFFPYNQPRWYSPFARLPAYWNEWVKWSKENQEKTVLLVPMNYFKRNWYRQDLGNANHAIAHTFGFSNIIFKANLYNELGTIIDYFISQNNSNFVKVMPVDYLLMQDDIDKSPQNYDNQTKKFNNEIVGNFAEKPVMKFGNKLTLYSVKPERRVPLIYITDNIYKAKNLNEMASIIANSDYKNNSPVFLENDTYQIQQDINLIKNDKSTDNTVLNINKITDTKYEITIHKINKPMILVFNTIFNSGWTLHANERGYIEEKKYHIQANGYSNSWLINPDEICRPDKCIKNADGSYDLNFTLDYWPQLVFTVGATINIFILLGCLSYLVLYFLRSRSK